MHGGALSWQLLITATSAAQLMPAECGLRPEKLCTITGRLHHMHKDGQTQTAEMN